MAFSGSYDYTESLTAANVIALALRRLGVLDPSETIDSTEEANALITLNLILKEWSAMGANVWTRNTFYLYLTGAEDLGRHYETNSSTSYFVTASSGTTVKTAASSGASTIDISTASFVSNGDLLFIELDSGEIEAHVANGAQSGDTVTLTGTLGGAVAAGKAFYVSAASTRWQERLVDILSVNRIIPDYTLTQLALDAGGQSIPMELIGSEEYRSLARQHQEGPPLLVYHRRNPNSSELIVWPTGKDAGVHKLAIEAVVSLQDLDATTDNIYIPPEGFNALAWQLAAEMSAEYGISEREYGKLWAIAGGKINDFLDSQVPDASVKFEQEIR